MYGLWQTPDLIRAEYAELVGVRERERLARRLLRVRRAFTRRSGAVDPRPVRPGPAIPAPAAVRAEAAGAGAADVAGRSDAVPGCADLVCGSAAR